MTSRSKCPKCGGLDGYGQLKNVVKGAGWFLRAKEIQVLYCRKCDIEMINTASYETNELQENDSISSKISLSGIITFLILAIIIGILNL